MPPVNVLVSGLPFAPGTLCLRLGDAACTLPAAHLADAVTAVTGLPPSAFYLRTHSALLRPPDPVTRPGQHTAFVALALRRALPGGKGGFGAMLRGAAASRKTTNFDACRDLHGRRLRHVRDERAVRHFAATEAARRIVHTPGASSSVVSPESPSQRGRKRARDDTVLPVDKGDNGDCPQDVEEQMDRVSAAVQDAVAGAVRARRKRSRGLEVVPEARPVAVEAPPDWMVDCGSSESEEEEEKTAVARLR